MAIERLTSSDRRLIWVVLIVAGCSILYTRANFNAAFPQASIDLQLSKEQITAKAAGFLRSRDLHPSEFRNVTLFDPNEEASVYLERELGLEQANRLMRDRLAIWRWRARWFRPPHKEERIVELAPDGRLVGFSHIIDEQAPGARLGKEGAFAIAESFLKAQSAAPHRLIEDQLVERPNRNDYRFTWEEEGFRAKDATYRRTVLVHGGTVGRYDEFLHVPEAWQRDFAALRSLNMLWAQGASALYIPLIIAALVVVFGGLRRRQIRWAPVLLIAGAAGVLMMLTNWNSLPLAIDRASTSTPLPETTIMMLLLGVLAGAGAFVYVALAAAAGEPLYRKAFPQHMPLSMALSRRAIRTREFFIATITGYGFAAAHIAFVVAFYLIGSRFGVWSPQEVQYSNLLSTYAPWLFPLTISLLAATSEEFWFRLFAIPLLKPWVRFTWLAVILPAFVWGFLHANYPQQPPYIRGIEVGVIGVAAGYLMIRFGILATLVWHYTVDAVLIGMFLFHAGNWYYVIAGCIVAGAIAIPLALSVISYGRRGGFVTVEPGVPESAAAPEPAPEEQAPEPQPAAAAHVPPAWPPNRLYLAGALGLLIVIFVRTPEFGEFVQVRLSRGQAQAVADAEMRRRNLDPGEWKRAAQFVSNLGVAPFEYIRRIAGRDAAERAMREHSSPAAWRIRYFRPGEKEEWRVHVGQAGTVVRIEHLLDEKAAGAQLPPEQARAIAEHWLAERGIGGRNWRLVDAQTQKREKRTDHRFVWEDPEFQQGEARARVEVQVIGDQAAFQRQFIKLPEQWLRDFQRPRLQRFLAPAMIGMFLVTAVVLFIRSLSRGDTHYHKRAYAWVTGAFLVLTIANTVNSWPVAYNAYNTAMPWNTFLASMTIGAGIIVLVLAVLTLTGAMALDVFRQSLTGDRPLTPPSVVRAVSAAALLSGVGVLADWLTGLAPGPRYSLDLWSVPGLNSLSPAVDVITGAAGTALFGLLLLGSAVLIGLRLFRPPVRWVLAAAVAGLYAAPEAATPLQWAIRFAAALIAVGVLALLVKTSAVDLVTFWVALFWARALQGAAGLAAEPLPDLRWNAVAVVGLAVCIGLGALRMARLGRGAAQQRVAGVPA